MSDVIHRDEFSSAASAIASAIGAGHASEAGSLGAYAHGALNIGDPLAIMGAAPLPDGPWWQRLSPSTMYVLLATAIGVLFLGHELSIAGKLGFPSDQAWTYQVFARNFFHHIAFEFNTGERTASPESPFWTVFLSIGFGLFHDPILTAKLLGAIFLFLAGYYSFRVLQTVGIERASALLGGALIMTAPLLAWSELSGLESCLASALVLSAIWWLVAAPRERWWYAAITGAIFALAALTRPEASILFLIVVVRSLFLRPQGIRNAGLMLAAFAITIAPIGLTNVALSGSMLPPALYASLSPQSALYLLRDGTIAALFSHILLSSYGVWTAIRDLYIPENPLWIVTIILALMSRARRPLIARDRTDALFSFAVVLLLLFPYLHALAYGTNAFEASWKVSFLSALYQLAGILSLSMLARRELFRSLTPKSALLWNSVTLLAIGIIVADVTGWSWFEIALFVILSVVFFFIAAHHAGVRLMKRELAHAVLEEERNKIAFHTEGSDLSSMTLSEPAVRALRGMLLIALAWNVAAMGGTARTFAEDTRAERTTEVAMAREIASVTPPTDAIAASEIGAIGYFSERRVIDLAGQLDAPREGAAIADGKPKHLAVFNDRDSTLVQRGLSRGLLALEIKIAGAGNSYAALYRVNAWSASGWK